MAFKLTPKQTRNIRPIAGILLLIIGVVAMFLPFLPIGYIFILGGIVLLAPRIPFLKRFLSFLERKDKKGRVKKAQEKIAKVEEKVENKLSTEGDDD